MNETNLRSNLTKSTKSFSIIMAAYNVEKYLDEAITSIVNQTLNFKKYVEIIIVNDGSSDNTLIVAQRWQNDYPDNIKVVDKVNEGVSAARNAGLKVSSGKIINFMDADDMLDSGALHALNLFFQNHADVKIVKIPLMMFEAKTGPHVLNKIFTKSEEIVNIESAPSKIFAHISSTFIVRSLLIENNLEFEVGRKYGEDLSLVAQIVEIEQKFGLINDIYYLYRARDAADSAMDSSRSDPETYIPNVEMLIKLAESNQNETGQIDKWLQMLIMYDIAWKVRREELPFVGDSAWYDTYLDKLTDILHYISEDVIDSQGHLSWVKKESIKYIKNSGKWPDYRRPIGNVIKTKKDVILSAGKKKYRLSNLEGKIYVAKYRPETDTLNLTIVINHLWGDLLSLVATDGDKVFHAESINEPARQKMISLPIQSIKTFEFNIDLVDLNDSEQLSFEVKYEGISLPLKVNFAGMLVSIGGGIKKNYVWSRTKLLRFNFDKNQFSILNNTVQNLLKLETDFKKGILATHLDNDRKQELIELRKLALRSKGSSQVINIFQDREDRADDNAEVFYQFVQKNHPEWTNVFVLKPDSPDWDRLDNLNYKLVEYGSKLHEQMLVQATNLISSQADLTIMRPWAKDYGYLRDAYHYNFIFLQHGVTKHDLSIWLRKIEKDIRVLVTVSDYEKKGFLDYGYEYSENEVVVTGFPRFDRFSILNTESDFKKEGVILIAPTWRNGIWGEADSLDVKKQKLIETEFFKKWQELLLDPRLEKLVETGNEILWLPHPHFREVDSAFEIPNYVREVRTDERYVDILKYSDTLVTDFSSIYFDMAYQNKPTIYYQFDSGNVNNKAGYFDFETMGFGPVFENLDGTMDQLQMISKNGFSINAHYMERIQNFFKYVDNDSSERLAVEVESLVKYKLEQEATMYSDEQLSEIFSGAVSSISLKVEKAQNKSKLNFKKARKYVKNHLKNDSLSYKMAKLVYSKVK